MANCIKIARRILCQRVIAKSRIIRKKDRITIPKPSKMKPEPTQNDSKIDAETGLLKKSQKVTFRIPFRFIAFGPKSDQNPPSCDFFKIFGIQKGIRKSMPKKYGKSMPEGSQNDQDGCQNHYRFILFQKRRKRSKLFVLQSKTWFLLTKKQ